MHADDLKEKWQLSLDDDIPTNLPCFVHNKMCVLVGKTILFVVGEEQADVSRTNRRFSRSHPLLSTTNERCPLATFRKRRKESRHGGAGGAHLGGIFGGAASDEIQFTAAEGADWLCSVPMTRLLPAITKTPLLIQPDATWHCGFSSDVLGVVLEAAAAQTDARAYPSSGSKHRDLGGPWRRRSSARRASRKRGSGSPRRKAHSLAECVTAASGFTFAQTCPTPAGATGCGGPRRWTAAAASRPRWTT